MQLEDTTGPLRTAADLLFSISRALDGAGPEFVGGWYKLTHRNGSGYAWLRLIGDRARLYPPQSIHLVVHPHAEFLNDPRLGTGHDWWGREDRHVVATVARPAELALAVEVLARAFALDDLLRA